MTDDERRLEGILPAGPTGHDHEFDSLEIEVLLRQARAGVESAIRVVALAVAPQLVLSGDGQRAERELEFISELLKGRSDPNIRAPLALESDVYFGIGLVHWYSGQFRQAAEYFERAKLFAANGHQSARANANLGLSWRQLGIPQDEVEKKLNLSDELKVLNPRFTLEDQFCLGLIRYAVGDLTVAKLFWTSAFSDGRVADRSYNDRFSALLSGSNLVTVLIELDDAKSAAATLEDVLALDGELRTR